MCVCVSVTCVCVCVCVCIYTVQGCSYLDSPIHAHSLECVLYGMCSLRQPHPRSHTIEQTYMYIYRGAHIWTAKMECVLLDLLPARIDALSKRTHSIQGCPNLDSLFPQESTLCTYTGVPIFGHMYIYRGAHIWTASSRKSRRSSIKATQLMCVSSNAKR